MTAPLQAQLVADRAKLRQLLQLHPDWTCSQFMRELNRSRNWVKDWTKRFRFADPLDQSLLWGKSHVPHKPHKPPDPRLLDRILEFRNNPFNGLKRIPGPKTLLYKKGLSTIT